MLLGKKEAGESPVVIGGGMIGCEVALWMAKRGKRVTLVEMLPEPMLSDPPVPHMNRTMLLDLLAVNGVEVRTNTRLEEITGEGITVTGKSSGRELIEADSVILATGLTSNNELYTALAGTIPRLYAIGYCREPRNIMGAVWDAYELASSI